MSNLLRIFTCSGVIALGAATAAATMLACGGSDDDPPADDGTTSSSSSSGGKTTTSSSSSSSGSSATCDPTGSYDFPAATWSGDTGVCVAFANTLNEQKKTHSYTYAKNADGTYNESEKDGDPNVLSIPKDSKGQCALTGNETNKLAVKDTAGNDAEADLEAITLIVFDGTKADYSGISNLTSPTAGAKGFPCKLEFEVTGTKK